MADLRPEEVMGLLRLAIGLKTGKTKADASGKSFVLLLEKPSLRTRVTFELAMRQIGGTSLSLLPQEVGLGNREPAADVARVLSRYVDIIAARVFAHRTLEELASAASVPVINALSDLEHPCQTLADLLTVLEHKERLEDVTFAYIGDGNNVAASLALGCALVGAHFHIASPKGYDLPAEILAKAREIAVKPGWEAEQSRHPLDAVRKADVVYTDVWTSMGQEAETEARRKAFQGFQVTPEVVELADEGAVFMHDLPAHPGEEIEPGMLDHPQSVVFDPVENRLHAQKAVLAWLLGIAGLPRS
jgi:ornithine carbamoyltransferase